MNKVKILRVLYYVNKYKIPIMIGAIILLALLGVNIHTTLADDGAPPNPEPI